jgi:NAD(P)-dependent dehydrogenase (short-subunit alcohol dehydrogenase family)
MNSKTALVTGGTSGVGLSIVRELVKNDFNVFFIGTDAQKGKEIEAELNKVNSSKNTFVKLDLSDIKKVYKFANTFKNNVNSLDLLANVAGVVLLKRQETLQQLEKTFTIGYLSAFILSTELIPLLEKNKHSRIVNVNGLPTQVINATLDFDNLYFKKKYSGFKTAIATVHAKTVLTEILSEKLRDKAIDVNSFHPGTVKSGLTRNMPIALKLMAKMVSPFMSKTSKNGIYTCLSNKITGITGQIIVNKKPIKLNFAKEYKEKLWKATEEIIAQAISN